MKSLTNILLEAIKWKHEDQTSVIKRLLQTYEEWEIYYTTVIMDEEDNIDVIEKMYGKIVNFVFLRKWNRKICKIIKMFIESVVHCKQ